MMRTVADTAWIVERARAVGFDLCGVAPAEKFPELAAAEEWFATGFAGEMRYLGDARRGEIVVSENHPFLFDLDYRLGLESETGSAQGPYLGRSIYGSHGYKVLEPADWQSWAQAPHGKIVIVNGSAQVEDVQAENALNEHLRAHCRILGMYRAAPEPAAVWKERFVKSAPVLSYRVDVTWYDCSSDNNPGGT